MDASRWSSLADELAAAGELFGDRGHDLVREWLDTESARVDDPAFARRFSEHVQLPGVAANDFAHRSIRSSRGELLGGIRFYGRDTTRPFVEVICHTFDDVDDLRDCVRTEWSVFSPHFLRLRARPGRFNRPDVMLDVTIHAARCGEMNPPDGRIALEPFKTDAEAVSIVTCTYDRLAAAHSALARNVSPATAEDLRLWREGDQLHAIRAGGDTVGLLAVAPGRIAWIEGAEINEEVVDPRHRGHGYAVAAQTAWAAERASSDPGYLLIGTIDRLNVASRRTAERAGRPRVLDAVFVALE